MGHTFWQQVFSPLLLIYQMPKVGSQTIEASLQLSGFPHPIVRLHYLSNASTKTVRRALRQSRGGDQWQRDARHQLGLQTRVSRIVRFRRLLSCAGFKVPKLVVITGVRELIALALSAIFENYAYFAASPEDMTIETCREALLHPKTCGPLRRWFDLELKRMIGVDVFRGDFPHAKGYRTYSNRFARVLLYRFEKLQLLPEMLKDFLGFSIPCALARNRASEKPYAGRYEAVKRKLRLPADFVDEQLDSRLMHHFYTPQERQDFRVQWTEAPVSAL